MPAASPPKAAPATRPRWPWLRRGLAVIGLLVLLLIVLYRPLAHWGIRRFGGGALAKAGVSGEWKTSGNLYSGLMVDDVKLTGDATSKIRSLTMQHAEIDYDLAALRNKGPGSILKSLIIKNVDAEIDLTKPGPARPADKPLDANKKPVLPAMILPELRIENLTLRVRLAKGEMLVRRFSLVLDPARPGYIQAEELALPGVPVIRDLKGVTHVTPFTLTLEQTSLWPDITLEQLMVNVANLPQDEAVFKLAARQAGARVEIAGKSANWFTGVTADLDMTVTRINQDTLAFWGVPAGKTKWEADQVSLKVKGPVLRPDQLALDLEVLGGSFFMPWLQLDSVGLSAGADAGQFTLKNLNVASGVNTAVAQGNAKMPELWQKIASVPGQVSATFTAPQLAGLLPPSSGITGEVTGKTSLTFADKTLTETSADWIAAALRVRGIPVERVQGRASLDDGVVKLEAGQIILNEANTLAVSGELGLAGSKHLSVSWQLDATDLASVPAEARPGFVWPTAGRIKSEGRAGGSLTEWQGGDWKSLTGQVVMDAGGVRINEATLQSLRIRASAGEGSVAVEEGLLKLDDSNYLTLTGGVNLTDDALPLTADVVLELPDVTKASAWSSQFKGPALQGGAVAVDWQGSGVLKPLKMDGKGSALVKGLKLSGVPEVLGLAAEVTQSGSEVMVSELKASAGPWRAEGSAHYDGWHLTIPGLQAFVKNERLVDLSGRVPVRTTGFATDSPLSLRLKVDQLDVARLASALGRELPVQGILSADGEFSGTLDTLSGQLNATATRLRAVRQGGPKIDPAEVKLTAMVKDGKLTLDGTAVQRPLQPLTITAAVPLDVAALMAKPDTAASLPLSAQVRLPASSLSFLPSWVPELRSVAGTAAADFTVGGTIRKPVLKGGATILASQATFDSNSLPTVKDVKVNLRMEGSRVALDEASVVLAGGRLRITGGAELDDASNPALNLKLAAEEVLVVRDENLSLRANADIACTGRLASAVVKGQVNLVRGRVFKEIEFLPLSLPNDLPPPPPPTTLARQGGPTLPAPFDRWDFDIAIKTRDPIRLMGNVAKGNAVADLRLTGLGAKPDLTGKVRLEQMWLKLPFSRLTISQGEVSFNREQPFDPQIDVRGESIIGSRIVQVFVQGRALDPKVRLTSSPPLPEGEIASLLATGVTTSDLNSSSDEAAGRAAFVLLKQTYRKLFRKSAVDTDDEEPPRLSFEFSVFGSDPTRRGISAVYELNPKWRIIGRVGETGTFRGLLHYLIRFR